MFKEGLIVFELVRAFSGQTPPSYPVDNIELIPKQCYFVQPANNESVTVGKYAFPQGAGVTLCNITDQRSNFRSEPKNSNRINGSRNVLVGSDGKSINNKPVQKPLEQWQNLSVPVRPTPNRRP